MENRVEVVPTELLKLAFKALSLTGWDLLYKKTAIQTRREKLIHRAKLCYFAFVCANIVLWLSIQMSYLATQKYKMIPLLKTQATAANLRILLTKIFSIWYNREAIMEFLKQQQHLVLREDDLDRKVKSMLRRFKRFETMKIFVLTCSTLGYFTEPIYEYFVNGFRNNSFTWELWISFDGWSFFAYNMTILWIDWLFVNVALLFFAADMMIYAIVLVTSLNFISLAQDIRRTIDTREDLSNLVERHCKLVSTVNKINKGFSVKFLLTFIGASRIVYYASYLIMTSNSLATKTVFVIFLFVFLSQIYNLCNFGKMIEESSAEIANAVAASDWYLGDKNLKIMSQMMAIQRPCTLMAWKFAKIDHSLLISVIKTTFWFFLIMRKKI